VQHSKTSFVSALPHVMRQCASGSRATCDSSEYSPACEARPARIIEIENPSDEFARRMKASDGYAIRGQDPRVGVDAQSAERKGDAAGHRIGFERRGIDRVGPI